MRRSTIWARRGAAMTGVAGLIAMTAIPIACGNAPAGSDVEPTGAVESALLKPCAQPVTSYVDCKTPAGRGVLDAQPTGRICSYAAAPNQIYCYFGIRKALGQIEGTCAGCVENTGHPWTTMRGEWVMQDPVPSNEQVAANPHGYNTYGQYDDATGSGHWNFFTRDWLMFGTYNGGTFYQNETVTVVVVAPGYLSSFVAPVAAVGTWSTDDIGDFTTVTHYPPDTTDYTNRYTFQISDDDNHLTINPGGGTRIFTLVRE